MYNKLYRLFINITGMLNRRAVRSSINFMKNEINNSDLIGAEVGVHLGRNSLLLLKDLDIKRLYLIDPYTNYKGKDGLPRNDFEPIKQIAHKKLKKYENQIVWIRDLSEKAYKEVKKNIQKEGQKLKNDNSIKETQSKIEQKRKNLRILGSQSSQKKLISNELLTIQRANQELQKYIHMVDGHIYLNSVTLKLMH